MENSVKVPKKIKLELPCNLAIPLLGIYPKKTKTLIQKDTYTPILTAVLFTIDKVWKQPECPLTDDKEDEGCVYTFIYIYIMNISHKKNETLPFAITCMDLEGVMLNE